MRWREIDALGHPGIPEIDAAAQGMAGLVRLGRLFDPCPTADRRRHPGRRAALAQNPSRPMFSATSYGPSRRSRRPASTSARGVVGSAEDAVATRAGLGFPVVLKIVSKDIAHKTEIGGVALNLTTRLPCAGL